MDRQGQGAYIPQELLKELSKVSNRLLIGIPCERVEGERRLALTPEAVDMLTDRGHRVLVEAGAGLGINYSDNHYSEAGAGDRGDAGRSVPGGYHPEDPAAACRRGDDDEAAYYAVFDRPV